MAGSGDVSAMLDLTLGGKRLIKIGFTGTQRGMTVLQAERVEQVLVEIQALTAQRIEFHHGDCIGADAGAHAIARRLNAIIVLHPPNNGDKRAFCTADITREPADYLVRNRFIVEGTDLLLAAPKHLQEEVRSETWTTVRRARQRHSPYLLVWANGSTTIP